MLTIGLSRIPRRIEILIEKLYFSIFTYLTPQLMGFLVTVVRLKTTKMMPLPDSKKV